MRPTPTSTGVLLDGGEPALRAVERELAAHQRLVVLLQLRGDDAGLAGGVAAADLAVVDRLDRRDLGGGAGEEDLVGAPELVAPEALLDHGVALRAQVVHHGLAGDAVEDRRERRGLDDAVADDEEILS